MRKATPAGQNLGAIAMMGSKVTMKLIKKKTGAVLMSPASHSCLNSTWWSWLVATLKTMKNSVALKILPQEQTKQLIQKLQKTR